MILNEKLTILGLMTGVFLSQVLAGTKDIHAKNYKQEENLLLCNENTIFMFEDSSLTGDVNGMLEEGDSAYVVEEGEDWYKISSGDYVGYVQPKGFKRGKQALKKASAYCEKQVTISTDTAFLNAASDLSGTTLALYTKEQQLEYIDSGNGWIMVRDENGIEGYLPVESVDTNYIYTYAKEPDIELYCELYPEQALTSYNDNEEYDTIHGVEWSYTEQESNSIDIGQNVCDYAMQFVGNPYVWGGESLQEGCDCSGFVMLIYKHFGITLPHSSYEMRQYGSLVCEGCADEALMLPGDIICYDGHVSIYLGNGKVISAAGVKYGIRVSHIGYRTDYICVRRLIGTSSTGAERNFALSEQDKSILYQIVEAEAGSQGYLGKTYVTNVILNRLLDTRFPNSIYDIVYSPGQFSPVSNGRIDSVVVSDDTLNAVEQALANKDNSNGALYFLNPELSDPCNVKWFNSELQHLFTYKDHAFYK